MIYVFGKKPVDVEDCVTRLFETFSSHSSSESSRRKNVVLRHDVAYTHQARKSNLFPCIFVFAQYMSIGSSDCYSTS